MQKIVCNTIYVTTYNLEVSCWTSKENIKKIRNLLTSEKETLCNPYTKNINDMQIWSHNAKSWFIEDFDHLDDYHDLGYTMQYLPYSYHSAFPFPTCCSLILPASNLVYKKNVWSEHILSIDVCNDFKLTRVA